MITYNSDAILFPYSTLFRSAVGGRAEPRGPALHRRVVEPGRGEPGAGHRAPARGARLLHVRQDRKSTRLNSSHITISYAVFCLKKKKNKKKDLDTRKHKPIQ